MTKPRITIIGLGLIGGSIGLGLTAKTDAIHIVGHDIEIGQSRLAKKKGAVHQTSINLINACEDSDLIIIATPITAIRKTLELIGPYLKQGCVVTDTALLKEPVLAWAEEMLPDGISFVGGDPLMNPKAQPDDLTPLQGLESARADLFENALYAICPSPKTPPAAVKRVSDMIYLLNARPFFLDSVEHDGMRAAVDGLPAMISLALMQKVGGSPGWREARKLAGHVFGMATASLAGDAAAQNAQSMLNAKHLVPRLDEMLHELRRLREWIVSENDAELEEAFNQAASLHTRWLADRAASRWEEPLSEADSVTALGTLGSMIGFGSRQRKRKDD